MWLFLFFICSIAAVAPCWAIASHQETVRIGLTPVFLDDDTGFVRGWKRYLETRLGQHVQFVQRNTYKEVTDRLLIGELDAAWICGFPYIRHAEELRLLAVPLYQGKPLYRSYLIVPHTDTVTQSITDLRGKIFAYSDPDSNSGYLVPQVELRKAGLDPHHFFGREFFTWAHRDVVMAVADGVADAGSVDGYVWDTMRAYSPELVARTRVVQRSSTFGFPPLVTRRSLASEQYTRLQRIFLDMETDPEGQRILQALNLDGFIQGEDRLYDGIRDNAHIYDGD